MDTNYSDKFLNAFKELIEVEGSNYTNDPDDEGGETKYGISRLAYPKLDIKNLSENDAKEIYLINWWNKFKLEEIENEIIATKLFLAIIHLGGKRAIELIQQACLLPFVSIYDKLAIDGILGPLTLKAINESHSEMLLSNFEYLLAKYYYTRVEERSSNKKYLLGWLRRAYK